jgi:outer membrane usher protein FimD/PapC
MTIRRIFFFACVMILAISPTARADERKNSERADAASAELTAAAVLHEPAANFPELGRSTTPLIVNISLNKEAQDDFFVERDSDGELFIKVEDLVALKLAFPQDRVVLIEGEKYVSLSAVRDISYSVDEKNLTVSILGRTTESKKTMLELYPLGARPRNLYCPRETSAFVNYGLSYSYSNPLGAPAFSLSNKVGARAGDVFFVSDSIYTETDTARQFVRLTSSATYEEKNELTWLVAGDQIANSGDLGSSVNMGGLGFSKLYRLDPYFTTQPLFNLQGVSQFPSEADIYLDGVLVGKQQVAPGPFELKNIYSYAGSHRVDVVLRDPFGNERKISYPFYFNSQMLREGLHEYSYNIGFLREQFGLKSDEYGKAAFSAFHRYGVTSAFNIGARAEGTDGLYNGGLSASFSLPRLGAFLLSASGSNAHGSAGTAASFQYSYQFKAFSTSALFKEFSRDYATIGAPPTSSMTKYAAILSAGFPLGDIGGFSLGYSTNETWDGSNSRTASVNYARALTRTMNLFANVSTTRAADPVNAFFIGLNFNPASNVHVAAQINKTGDTNTETVQLQKDTPLGEGLGYRASLNRSFAGSSTSYGFNPGLQYNARYGIYMFDSTVQSSENGNTTETYNVSASGSVVYAGGFFGLARPVNDSFSIVMVDNLPNASVLNNGQELGKTDSSGKMVVPTLASYGQNQITVDAKSIPLDYGISDTNKAISPSSWSGSCVSFDAVKVRALTGTLYFRNADNKTPLEFFDIMMKVGKKTATFPTGKGGEFYMENSLPDDANAVAADNQSCRAIAERRKTGGNVIKPGAYHAEVDFDGKKCGFEIVFPDTDDVITDLGEILCVLP